MGTGKTLTAVLAAIKVGGLKLVLCPKIAVDMWREVLENQGAEAVVIRKGADRHYIGVKEWTIVPYSLVSNLKHKLDTGRFAVCILDEAHYLKTRTAQRTKAVYGYGQVKGIVESIEYVFALTGTPMPNHAGELYPMLRALAPELIHSNRTNHVLSQRAWEGKFCTTKTQYVAGGRAVQVITGTKDHEKLNALIRPFYRRRKLDEVMENMPRVTTRLYPLSNTGKFRNGIPVKFYEDPTDEQDQARMDLEMALADGPLDYERAMSLQAGTQSTLRRELGLSKTPQAFEAIKADLESGVDKAVVFFWHRQVGAELRRLFQAESVSVFHIDGSTPGPSRKVAEDQFRDAEGKAVFLGQILACGVAINLQFAHDVYFVEMDWVPGNNAQALGRCVRIGQTLPVNARFFAGQDNVEYNLVRSLIRKIEDIVKVIK